MRTTFCSPIRCITTTCLLLLAVAVLSVALLPTPTFAQSPPPGCPTGESCNCIQNEFNIQQGANALSTASSNSLVCTANDVRIAEVINVRDFNGNTLVNCTENQPFSFIADFEVVTSSKSTRSNIGMYIAKTGTTVNDVLSVTNSCADNIIPPPIGFTNTNLNGKKPTNGANGLFPCPGATTVMCGTDWYDELDTGNSTAANSDNCGDTSSADNGKVGGVATAGAQQVTLEITGFTCPDPNTTTLPQCTVNGVTGPCAVLPNCTSWQVPGKTLNCVTPDAALNYPTVAGIPEAVPGDKSKCNCGVITLPILVQTPVINVLKGCNTNDSGAPNPAVAGVPSGTNQNCSSGVEGQDEVTYTVEVDNQSNTGNITLNSLTDSVYGDIAGTCPGGTGATLCTADSTTCTATGQTITDKSSYTCTFTAHKSGDPGPGNVTDFVKAAGSTQFAGPWGPENSDMVTVTPTEAPAMATVTKGLGNPTAACVTVSFSVDVKNTSNTGVIASSGVNATTFDEAETLTGLSDNVFGNIATPGTLGAGVLSSTCTVPQPLAVGADYMCSFSAQVCSPANSTNLATLEEFNTGSCNVGTGACTTGHLNFCASNSDCGAGGVCSGGACSPGTLTRCSANSDCDLTCLGVTHTNSVTASIQGDEATGNPLSGDLVTPAVNVLTSNICIAPFVQSQ